MDPRLAPDAQASRAEERLQLKRLRQRTYVKQAYDRQKLKMASLRQQLATLQGQFAQLLAPSVTGATREATVKDEPASELLLQKYSKLTQLRCSLVVENGALHNLHAELIAQSQSLHSLILYDTPAKAFYFHSLTVSEYELVVAKARAHVVQSMAEPEKPYLDELGWTVSRTVEGDALTFSLKKLFKTFSAHELLTRSWAILSSPAKYTQLYSASVRAELHLLQHVDDDTLLYYTELASSAEATKLLRSVYLLHREPFANGYLILVCSVDPSRSDFEGEFGINHIIEEARSGVRPPSGSDPRWATMCAWMLFEEDPDSDSSLFTYGGSSRDSWAIEVQCIAMQWQFLVVGYDSLLQHEDGYTDVG